MSGIIQLGVNTMQATFVLELQFAPAEEQHIVNGRTYDATKASTNSAGDGTYIETVHTYGDKYYEF